MIIRAGIFARLTEDHRHWLHAHGGTWRSVLSATFLTHRTTRRRVHYSAHRAVEPFIILANKRNLQKFSWLCQAQYRKPTGRFLATFTQSGSTASVSASMASSSGRYRGCLLTNTRFASAFLGLAIGCRRLGQHSSTPGSKTRDRSNVTQRQVSLNGACAASMDGSKPSRFARDSYGRRR
jgi:hypothetical protein